MNGRASVMGNVIAGGTSSVGFAFRSVVIQEVLPNQNICSTMDVQTAEKISVGLNKRGTDSWPQVGEQWVLNKSTAGHWILAIKITATQPPTFSGNADTMDSDLIGLANTLVEMGLLQLNFTNTGLGWQDPTSLLSAGWAIGPNSGSVQPLRYRITAQKLEMVGTIHTTSSSPTFNVLTLPATPVNYRPATGQRVGIVSNASGTPTARFVDITSAGVVSVQNALAASGVDVYFDVSVPRTLLP
jgi:hypothetical protein